MFLPAIYRLEAILNRAERYAERYHHTAIERVPMDADYQRAIADYASKTGGFAPNGVCVATDGFAMAVVPCQIEPEDGIEEGECVVGFHRKVLPVARHSWCIDDSLLHLRLEPEVVRLDQYTTVQRQTVEGDQALRWRGALHEVLGADGEGSKLAPHTGERFRALFAPALVLALGRALGFDHYLGFSYRRADQQVVVLPDNRPPGLTPFEDFPAPPFGLLMPAIGAQGAIRFYDARL